MKRVRNQLDMYGEGFGLNFKGRDKVKTYVGLMATVVTIALGLAYFVLRATVMASRGDTKTFLTVEEGDSFSNL